MAYPKRTLAPVPSLLFWAAAVALAALFLTLSGCSSTNLADILQAAAQDPATICSSIMTPYGSVPFARTNCTNCELECNQGHLTIKTTPPAQAVGVQFVPLPAAPAK